MRRQPLWPCALVACAILAAGCGAGVDGPAERVSVRDSAGVTVVENLGTVEELPEWRLSAQPKTEIGVVSGDDAYQFSSISGAGRLASGSYVVLDRQSGELRWFSADGLHRRTFGGRGEGPGEFSSSLSLHIIGDSAFVFDQRQRRWTVVGPEGSGTSVTSAPVLEEHRPVAAWPHDNAVIIAAIGPRQANMSGNTELRRDPMLIFRAARDGTILDTLATIMGPESLDIAYAGSVLFASPAFPRSTVYTSVGDVLFHGDAETFELEGLSLTTGARHLIRFAGAEQPLPPEEVENFRDFALEWAATADPDGKARIDIMLDEGPIPETRPAYAHFLGSSPAQLWVGPARYNTHPDPSEPLQWLVFDANGTARARLLVPAEFRILDAGPDYVVGTWRGELDVETLRVYTLITS